MGDPEYVYRPWSEERRAKLSLIHKRRLGVPDGYSRICGVHVLEEVAPLIKDDAYWIAHNRSKNEAADFVERAAQIDDSLIGELFEEGTTFDELAEYCGLPNWHIEKRTKGLRRINRKRVPHE